MDDVNQLLRDTNLREYSEIFANQGFDDVNHILTMGPAGLHELRQHTNMSPGHFARLQSYVLRVQEAGSATAAAATVVTTAGTQMARVLPDVFKTWDEAKLASYEHSTSLGCSCGIHKQSGGNRKIFRCRTITSKRKRDEIAATFASAAATDGAPARPPCGYTIYWSKLKDGLWHLNRSKSKLTHGPLCGAGQHVRDQIRACARY